MFVQQKASAVDPKILDSYLISILQSINHFYPGTSKQHEKHEK